MERARQRGLCSPSTVSANLLSTQPGAALPASAAVLARPTSPVWRVHLLGTVEAQSEQQTLSRWPTRAVAALLARLALAPQRAHSREALIEMLWPGVAPDVGRNRLRQALSTLRGLLEPRGPHEAPVLLADRLTVRLAAGALWCDALAFERLAREGQAAAARTLYRGELMPGFYDDWVLEQRERLADLHERLGEEPLPPAPARPAPMPRSSRADARTARSASGLPNYLTRAFGLELSASRLRALVLARRLVTVHGPGGSGKTRLAAEVSQSLCEPSAWTAPGATRFERLAFVSLLPCVSVEQVLDAIAEALSAGGSGTPQARIAAALAGQSALLVLDNAEQLQAAVDVCLLGLLAAQPGLHLLVTSRRLLDLDGEVAFEADGLQLPAPDHGTAGATRAAGAADEAMDNPAVALFVDRARAVCGDFALDARNVAAVIALVRLLGGMPLAIELAASRMRSLTAGELLHHLREQPGSPTLDLLSRGATRASADARHASMRHVVAWSWRQLSPAQVAVLHALSVFTSPARLEAVAAVAATPLGDVTAAPLLLDELRDASLLRVEQDSRGRTRYALLQPVREFAAETVPPALARAARGRLRAWLIEFAHQESPAGPSMVAPEMDHVHAAIVSAGADAAGTDALRLAAGLRSYWDSDSLPLSSMLALEQAVTDSHDAALRCDVHELLSFSRGSAGFAADAVRHAEAAQALAPDDGRRSVAMTRWVWAMYFDGRYDTDFDKALDRAISWAEGAADLAAQALALRVRALITCNLKLDYSRAEQLAEQAQALYERLGNRQMVYFALINRTVMWAWLGRNDEALAVMAEIEPVLAADGDWAGLMHCTRQMGRVLIRLRRFDDAVAAFRRSLHTCWQHRLMQGLAMGLLHLPEALLHGPELEAAAQLQGFAPAHWARLFPRLNRIEAREMQRARRMLRLRLGSARAESLRVAGSSLTLAGAVALAMGGG